MLCVKHLTIIAQNLAVKTNIYGVRLRLHGPSKWTVNLSDQKQIENGLRIDE